VCDDLQSIGAHQLIKMKVSLMICLCKQNKPQMLLLRDLRKGNRNSAQVGTSGPGLVAAKADHPTPLRFSFDFSPHRRRVDHNWHGAKFKASLVFFCLHLFMVRWAGQPRHEILMMPFEKFLWK
jgi:hypothetical protein